MHTLNDYLNATPAEQDAEHARRGWAPRPPIAHTHRKPGKPVTTGPRTARLDATHRADPRPLTEQLWDVTRTAARTHA